MGDMIVKLCGRDFSVNPKCRIVRVLPPDKYKVIEFIEKHFSKSWASECEAGFCHFPVSCFAALNESREIIGFACYEATCKGYFGPIGVLSAYRGQGIGRDLLKKCLEGLKEIGYAYAIIGDVGEKARNFYEKTVGAALIDESPSIYAELI